MLEAVPITREGYAPFGALVAAVASSSPRAANHGTASAWDGLAALENLRPTARGSVALFRCAPLGDAREAAERGRERSDAAHLDVRWLERHAHSTQLFVPMNATRYLVVVALGGEAPDLETLRAFVVPGRAAISYAPGTWHHPMVALDHETDFANVLHVDGTSADCDEVAYDPPCARVRVPAASSLGGLGPAYETAPTASR
jgi:ureidoglycolate lyase